MKKRTMRRICHVSVFVAYQTNSLQTEQKVGWGKNVALNSWHLTMWILACLMAPRRWWRANRPSRSGSDSCSPSVWPAASETKSYELQLKQKTDSEDMHCCRAQLCFLIADCQEDFTPRLFLTFCGWRSVTNQHQSFTLTKSYYLTSCMWVSLLCCSAIIAVLHKCIRS